MNPTPPAGLTPIDPSYATAPLPTAEYLPVHDLPLVDSNAAHASCTTCERRGMVRVVQDGHTAGFARCPLCQGRGTLVFETTG